MLGGMPRPARPARQPQRLPFTPRKEPVAVRVRQIAGAQEGVIATSQLLAAGLSPAKITRWVAEGHLCRRHRTIYTVGHDALSQRGELVAALLYAGPGAALSHVTSAWWRGVIGAAPRRIHVSATHSRPSTRDIKVHCPRELEVVEHRGLPVTTVARIALDLAATLAFRQLRRIVAEIEYQGLASLAGLEAECRRGRPGSRALRRALRLHRPELARTRSPLEERWVFLCEEYGIPMPEMNASVCGLMVDALWREQRLVVELDGVASHAGPARMEADRGRELRLRAAGFTVLRYTWTQVTRAPAAVAADALRALRGRK